DAGSGAARSALGEGPKETKRAELEDALKKAKAVSEELRHYGYRPPFVAAKILSKLADPRDRRRSHWRPDALNERNPPISRNTTATTGRTPAADGAIFVVSAAICVGNTMRRRPTTSESHRQEGRLRRTERFSSLVRRFVWGTPCAGGRQRHARIAI